MIITKIKKWQLSIVILVLLAFYIIVGLQTQLELTTYTYSNVKIPEPFDGFRILHISDFHCASFGYQESELINIIKSSEPDLIVFTGDMADNDHNIQNLAYLLEGIYEVAPIYAITGNHETDTTKLLQEVKSLYSQYKINLLENANAVITRKGASIYFYGSNFADGWKIPAVDTTSFHILLDHSSAAFDYTKTLGYDLILSGHAHGGVIRLPIVGGLIDNRNFFFPKYSSGVYTHQNATLISNRGLGDTDLPRFYNDPEIILITLDQTKP